MPADREKLRTTLNELRAELAELDQLDPEAGEDLRATLAEIQAVLDKTEQKPAAAISAPSLIQRLNDTARRLEESHPVLANAVGNFSGMLGQMGF